MTLFPAPPGRPPFTRGQALGPGDPGHLPPSPILLQAQQAHGYVAMPARPTPGLVFVQPHVTLFRVLSCSAFFPFFWFVWFNRIPGRAFSAAGPAPPGKMKRGQRSNAAPWLGCCAVPAGVAGLFQVRGVRRGRNGFPGAVLPAPPPVFQLPLTAVSPGSGVP